MLAITLLCSLAGDLKVAETVDVPHTLVTTHMPKHIRTPDPLVRRAP